MSRRTDAKKARRSKRRAKRDVNWIPDTVLEGIVDDVELVEGLESFDSRITERGWTFDDDQSDEEFASGSIRRPAPRSAKASNR